MSTIQRYVAEAAQAESLRRGPETFAERHVFVDLTELLTYLADREASLAAFRGDLRPLTAGLDCFLQGVLALGPASVTLAQDGNPSQAVALHCLPLQMAQAAAATRFQRTGNVKFAQEAFRLSPRQRLQVHEHLVASFPAVRSLIAPVLARHYVRGYDIAVSQAQWALLSAADVVPSFHALGMLLSGELATLEVYDAQFLEHVLGQDRDRLALLLGDEYFPGYSVLPIIEHTGLKYQKLQKLNIKLQKITFNTAMDISKGKTISQIATYMLGQENYIVQHVFDDYNRQLTSLEVLMSILERQMLQFYSEVYNITTQEFSSPKCTNQDSDFSSQYFCSYFKSYHGNTHNSTSIIQENLNIYDKIIYLLQDLVQMRKFVQFNKTKHNMPLTFEEYCYFAQLSIKPRSGAKVFLAEMQKQGVQEVSQYVSWEKLTQEDPGELIKRILRR